MLKTAVYCFIYLLESLIKRKTPPFGPLDYAQLSMQNLKVVFELTDNSKLDRGGGGVSTNIWIKVSRWSFETLKLFRKKQPQLDYPV